MENKKVEDCHFFVSGHCNKGDSCEFRHNPEVRGQPICINWLLEQCSDPDCPNRHPTLPRTPQRTRTLCFFNQACTRPDCLFLHTGTIASPAMPRPDQETQLTVTLTPRNASAKGTSSPVASTSPVIKPAAPAQVPAPSGPLRPVRNRTAVLPTLPPRDQSSASAGASTASFVKSFDEIMKDKEHQEKGTKSAEPSKQPPTAKPREEPQQRKADNKQARTRPSLAEMSVPRAAKGGKHSTSATATAESSRQERAKGNGIRSRPASSGTSTTASSSSSTAPSFGVKTLEELLQEKNNSKPASASAAGAPSRPGGAGGVKRGREESAATTRALPQPQQKQPRADLATKPTAPLQPVEEEDDLEKELAEIGVDDINSMAGEVIDDDELNELLEG